MTNLIPADMPTWQPNVTKMTEDELREHLHMFHDVQPETYAGKPREALRVHQDDHDNVQTCKPHAHDYERNLGWMARRTTIDGKPMYLPTLELEAFHILALPIMFDAKESCEVFITHSVLGAGTSGLTPVTLVPVEVFGSDCECHETREDNLDEIAAASADMVDPGVMRQALQCSGWSYGLSDAVQAWSDCNRAIGHIYRVDDTAIMYREPDETIRVYVPRNKVDWFKKQWGEDPEVDRASAAKYPIDADSMDAVADRLPEDAAKAFRDALCRKYGTPEEK